MTDGNKRILAYGLVLIMVVSMCTSMVWDFVSHADESSPASVSEETGILPCETADEPEIAIPIEIMAHRGFKEVFPENTIFAMESAMSSGYNGVEIDVWESENGNLMISHDTTTDRMCGVSDFIWHVNSSNRSNYPIAWNGINLQIPTLTEVMEFARDTGATVFLHIKTAKGYKLSNAPGRSGSYSGQS